MARGTAKIIGFDCPTCGAVNTLKCRKCGEVYKLGPVKAPGEKWIRKPIPFSEGQWERLVASAKATPGVNGPAELVRLALKRALSMPLQRLIALQRTKHAQRASLKSPLRTATRNSQPSEGCRLKKPTAREVPGTQQPQT